MRRKEREPRLWEGGGCGWVEKKSEKGAAGEQGGRIGSASCTERERQTWEGVGVDRAESGEVD
jgi:hypothetical protein